MTHRSRRSTFSEGRKAAMSQKMTAAKKLRDAMYPIGVTQSLSSALLTGTPSPNITFAAKIARCP